MTITIDPERYRLADGHNVTGLCPDCGAISRFLFREEGREFGFVVQAVPGQPNARKLFRLFRCGGCGRGALAAILTGGVQDFLLEFYPTSWPAAALPKDVPKDIESEYREAEQCAAAGAFRASSAMTRSVLEKALVANGYTTGNLKSRIDQAAKDGVITAARKMKAHEDIRVLGNEVVHDPWREVAPEEATLALHYAHRILEDLYDDRATVEATLKALRTPASVPGAV